MLDFIKDKKDCTACGVCINICPQNCISLETDADGFLFPVKDTTRYWGKNLKILIKSRKRIWTLHQR